jgi:PAS domain S-box-containing protein
MYIKEGFKALVMMAEVGVVRVDARCIIRFVNPCMLRMLDLESEGELIGKRFMSIVDVPDRGKVIEKFRKRRKGCAENYVVSLLGRDGVAWAGSLSAVPLFRKGKFDGSFAMIRDMTPIVSLIERIKSSELRFRNLAKQLPAAILELSPDSSICYCNDFAYELLGLGRRDKERTLRSFVAEDELARYERVLGDAFEGGERNPFPMDLVRRDGERLPALWSMALERWRKDCRRVSIVIIEIKSVVSSIFTCDDALFVPYRLTDRERAVARRLVGGLIYKEIASDLGISLSTVRTHTMSIYRKMEIHARAELVDLVHSWQIECYGKCYGKDNVFAKLLSRLHLERSAE